MPVEIQKIAQRVAPKIGIEVPSAFLSSTARELVELKEIANDAMEQILEAAYWQDLMTIHTITGDASTTAWDMPTDYLRMDDAAKVWSSSLETPLSHIKTRDEWLGQEIQSYDYVINAWNIYGSQMNIKPALASGVTAKYFYQKNTPILATNGTTRKSEFTSDTDYPSFTADQNADAMLLRLCMIYMWKEQKGFAYQEDEGKYMTQLAKMTSRDKGARTLILGQRRIRGDIKQAYPVPISG